MTDRTEALSSPISPDDLGKLVWAILHSRFPHESFTVRSQQISVLATIHRYASAGQLINRTALMEELGIQRTTADNLVKLMESRGVLFRDRARGRHMPGRPIDLYIHSDALEAFLKAHHRQTKRTISFDLGKSRSQVL